ncbi:hypothetical protein G7046_g8530 [Stylonectria norvegica]|nr:hypothetical protein G7046_g8530 [Stylonectria norvegica]
MALSRGVANDAEVHRLLNQLHQYEPQCNSDDPATDVKTNSLVDNNTTKENPYPRIRTIAERLGLGGRRGTPWLLFLYLGPEMLSIIRLRKEFSAWLGRPHSIDPEAILSLLNEKAVRRHGLNITDYPPQVTREDVRAVMDEIDQVESRSSVDSASVRGTATPAPTAATSAPISPPVEHDHSASAGVSHRMAKRARPAVGTPSIDGQIGDEDRYDTPEIGRRSFGIGGLDADLSMSSRRSSSGRNSGPRLRDHVRTLGALRRLRTEHISDPNLRAVTDSINQLAGVALRMMGENGGADELH